MTTHDRLQEHGLGAPARVDSDELDLAAFLSPLRGRWPLLLGTFVIAGALGAAASFLITPEFTSTTTFLPPQQQQSSAASALASLGGLAGLAAVKSPADEYVSLMQSVTILDRMVDHFKLMDLYGAKFRVDARNGLAGHTLITSGKKDGLISVAVDDVDPKRAAAMANQYVEELRWITSNLAVTEAQQRRVFFERQMQDTKAKLIVAQSALQQSGFTAGAIKTEPEAAAAQYAQLRAQATAADVRLQTLRTSLTEDSPEVRQQSTLLQALRSKLEQLEASTKPNPDAPDYVSKYREFKYQETLFDLMSKQYELARADESREGALIQVVDPAQPAERKSRPKRSFIAVGTGLAITLGLSVWLLVRARRRSPIAA